MTPGEDPQVHPTLRACPMCVYAAAARAPSVCAQSAPSVWPKSTPRVCALYWRLSTNSRCLTRGRTHPPTLRRPLVADADAIVDPRTVVVQAVHTSAALLAMVRPHPLRRPADHAHLGDAAVPSIAPKWAPCCAEVACSMLHAALVNQRSGVLVAHAPQGSEPGGSNPSAGRWSPTFCLKSTRRLPKIVQVTSPDAGPESIKFSVMLGHEMATHGYKQIYM